MAIEKEVSYRARGSIPSLVPLQLVMLIPTSINIAAAFKHYSFIPPAVGLVLFQLLLIVWVKSFEIEIEGGNLGYRCPFAFRRTIPLDRIRNVKIEVGYSNDVSRFRPPIRAVVYSCDQLNHKNIDINIKVFSRGDVVKLLQLLGVDDG